MAVQTIDSLIRSRCETFADRTALRQKVAGVWRETTYRELWQTSGRVASLLHKRGFRSGDHAAILAPSSSRWVESYLGILRAGGVVIPVDKELKTAELRHVLSDSGARVIFTDTICLDTLLECMPHLPALETVIMLHPFKLPPSDPKGEKALEALHLLLPPTRALQAELVRAGKMLELDAALPGDATVPHPLRTTADTAVILYTSGTTGRAKGAMLSHGNIVSNILGAACHFNLDHSMHTLSFLPINHVFEQVVGMLLPLSVGGRISFAESLKKLGENLAEVKPTFLLGVPAVYRMILERIHKNIDAKRLSRIMFAIPLTRPLVSHQVKKAFGAGTIFISGGAALDPAIAKGLGSFGIPVYQGYGITETSPVISAEKPGATRLGTVGVLLPDVQVRIDARNDEGVGEILVKGPNVMQGYYNNPEATAEVLQDGWYRSGDLGRLDNDGYLSICGRVKNLIVTPNGKNVYPEEVENELLKSRFIAEAMVYARKVGPLAEEVHAMIYPNQEEIDSFTRKEGRPPLSQAEVEGLIRDEVLAAGKQLADYKRVKRFTLREEEFPKTTTRKIKRFAVDASVTIHEGD